MRVVLTVHQFLPEYASGTEILTYEVAKALQSKGHHVSIFAGFPSSKHLTDDERFTLHKYSGINIVRFNHNLEPMGNQKNVYEIEYDNHLVGSYFRNYLVNEKPDIVHFFHLMRLSASPIDVCFELGIPTVFTPTDFWMICPTCQLRLADNRPCEGPDKYSINCLRHIFIPYQPLRIRFLLRNFPDRFIAFLIILLKRGVGFDNYYSPLIRALSKRRDFLQSRLNRVNKIIVPTENMRSKLTQNGLELKRAISIPYGINIAYFKNPKKRGLNPSLRIGYIGTIAEHKGLHILIDAVHKLVGKPVELNIYGKTDEFSEYFISLREVVRNDPRVKFLGTFPNKNIGKVFSTFDVLVVPSIWYENSPLVIYSAQAAGCPVIVSNMAGMTELIDHRKNGLIFEAGDSAQLAAAIQTLMNDRYLLRKLADNAKKPLSVKEYTEKLELVYTDALREKDAV